MALRCEKMYSYSQDGLWSWFICFCTTVRMIVTIGFTFALGVLFPVLMDSFEETRERTAWVSSIVVGVVSLVAPVMGGLLNRFGVRITTILACLSCSAGLAMGSFAPRLIVLYISFSLPFALGLSFIYTSSPIIVTYYFTKRRSFALGIVTAGQGLGTMILGPTLQVVVDVLGWRNTFRVFAGVLAVVSVTGCFLHQRKTSPDENPRGPSKKFRLNLSLLKNPTILVLVIRNSLCSFARFVPYVHLVKYCDDLGIPADKSSTLFLFLGIFAALGRLGGGFLCNVRFIKAGFLQQAAAFIVGSSTMLLILAKTYSALVTYVITFAIADGIMITSVIIECMESVEESKRASTLGFFMLAGGIVGMTSPPFAGFMADKFGDYVAAFLIAGGVGIIGSLVPFLLFCVQSETEQHIKQVIDETVDQKQSGDVAEHELKTNSCSQDSTLIICRNYQRPSSFIEAMESPIY